MFMDQVGLLSVDERKLEESDRSRGICRTWITTSRPVIVVSMWVSHTGKQILVFLLEPHRYSSHALLWECVCLHQKRVYFAFTSKYYCFKVVTILYLQSMPKGLIILRNIQDYRANLCQKQGCANIY